MPPERFPPDDPREWLNRARSNLARAKTHISEVYLEDYCFDAQRGIAFPYVHDLARLLTLLEEAGQEIPERIRRAESLTRYAVVTRYPGLAEAVTEQHYQEAVASAEAVIRWAEEAMS